ncbi:hypothetical protein ACNVED_11630 [Legionella sp. D16C41]|uniref:hypothetical protein n=1 Tax=Legionella sp. D16C41 TaxID=3402688 RepID=UPI003AF6472A
MCPALLDEQSNEPIELSKESLLNIPDLLVPLLVTENTNIFFDPELASVPDTQSTNVVLDPELTSVINIENINTVLDPEIASMKDNDIKAFLSSSKEKKLITLSKTLYLNGKEVDNYYFKGYFIIRNLNDHYVALEGRNLNFHTNLRAKFKGLVREGKIIQKRTFTLDTDKNNDTPFYLLTLPKDYKNIETYIASIILNLGDTRELKKQKKDKEREELIAINSRISNTQVSLHEHLSTNPLGMWNQPQKKRKYNDDNAEINEQPMP